MKKHSFFDKFIFVVTLIISLLLLLACVVPYTTSATFSFLSLVVPLLVIFNLFSFFYWLVKKRWFFLISLISLVTGYISLGSFVQFSFENVVEDENQLKVMSYNAQDFSGYRGPKGLVARRSIVEFISSENPSIVSFQEYNSRIKKIQSLDSYPYQFIGGAYNKYESRVLQAIYSKNPIINKGELNFPQSANHGIYADIVIELDTLRVYNLHLESLSIRPGMVKSERSDRLFKRLRNSFAKQNEQALIFRENADKCPYIKIVCGDFNNTQFSSAYRIIKGDMNDSFAEKGNGYGKTINFWRFPLRIDFILADPKFEVLSHKNFNIGLSDHEPVMASFKLNSDE